MNRRQALFGAVALTLARFVAPAAVSRPAQNVRAFNPMSTMQRERLCNGTWVMCNPPSDSHWVAMKDTLGFPLQFPNGSTIEVANLDTMEEA